jgi:Co/Zn/Cd efflux system component
MVDINLTIIVQIINFLVAYTIIGKMLFRPGIALINHDEDVQRRLQQEQRDAQELLHQKELHKQDLWKITRHKFALALPRQQEIPPVPIGTELHLPKLNPALMQQEIDHVSKLLQARITHD